MTREKISELLKKPLYPDALVIGYEDFKALAVAVYSRNFNFTI
jgi:hypothetical protein